MPFTFSPSITVFPAMPIRWPPPRSENPAAVHPRRRRGKNFLCNPSYRGYPSVRRDNLSPTPRSVLRPGSESTPDPLRPPEAARGPQTDFLQVIGQQICVFQNFPYIRRKQAQSSLCSCFFSGVTISFCLPVLFIFTTSYRYIYEMAGQVMHDFYGSILFMQIFTGSAAQTAPSYPFSGLKCVQKPSFFSVPREPERPVPLHLP